MDWSGPAGLGGSLFHSAPPIPHPPLYDPFWEIGTFTSVQDTILPSDDTEKKLRLLSISSFCHLTWNIPNCER